MALVAGGLAVSLPAVLLRTDTCRPVNCFEQQNADVSTCILLPACTSARNTAMKLSCFSVPWLYSLTQPFWDHPWTTLVSLSTEFEQATPIDKRKLSNNCYHAIKLKQGGKAWCFQWVAGTLHLPSFFFRTHRGLFTADTQPYSQCKPPRMHTLKMYVFKSARAGISYVAVLTA